MNNLSLLIYLAEISDNLRVATLILSLAFTAAVFGSFVFFINARGTYGVRTDHERATIALSNKVLFRVLPAMFFSWLVFIIVPPKSAVYTIAASQIGEQIIQLEEVRTLGGEAAELARVSIEALRAQISSTIPVQQGE